ncbi:hypothetical protein [Catenulispora rubra]|uniref:hypothetical protein n=1 Tax=Catenulispora rubra TaxID=280293 RepID=UPI0018920705|nr:hypothetical protein [Catenulispora rubra]
MHRPAPTGKHSGPLTASSPRTSAISEAGRITHTEMIAAIAAGTAQTLSRTITDIARHQEHWWLYDRDEWLQVDDAGLTADLDAAAALMANADQQVRRLRQMP